MSQEEIQETIAQLGFQPRIDEDGQATRPSKLSESIPEPIASALNRARASGKYVFIDFYAEWCAPCKILDRTFPDSRVQEALKGFIFLKVDTDVHPRAGQRFEIFGMPTLLVLDGEGEERYRHLGPIEPADLAGELLEISPSAS